MEKEENMGQKKTSFRLNVLEVFWTGSSITWLFFAWKLMAQGKFNSDIYDNLVMIILMIIMFAVVVKQFKKEVTTASK